MEPSGTIIGLGIAVVLIVIALYFGRRQFQLLKTLRSPELLSPIRVSHLRSQAHCRLFSSLLLIVLAGMMVGLLFFEYDTDKLKADNPNADGKQAMQFLSYYLITMLMVLMVLLVLAVLDFWATTRFGFLQQRQLVKQHLQSLQADLDEQRHRQSGSE